MKTFENKVAVITGAGSGMGKYLAINLAKAGSSVAICDVNKDTLKETEDILRNYNVPSSSYVIDVSDKEEINFLEGMINNLLLSDRLSMPYSKLDLENYTTREVVNKLMDMFPVKRQKIKIDNHVPDKLVYIDETKFTLALRNLLDNALKYSKDNVEISLIIVKNDDIEFQVKDSGIGVSKKNI